MVCMVQYSIALSHFVTQYAEEGLFNELLLCKRPQLPDPIG